MNISPITLGTAQLTTPYGIVNTGRMPNKKSAFNLLENALMNGITTWDTSPVYGQSEKIIGEYLNINKAANVIICTKLPSIVKKYGKEIKTFELINIVSKYINKSLKSLNREKLDYFLIHDEKDYMTYGSKLIHALVSCIDEGKVDNIGLSVYSPQIASIAFQKEDIDTIQLPLNIFDNRFMRHIINASAKNIKIFVRSVYLQGLFFTKPNVCKKKVPLAYEPLKKLVQLSTKYELSIAEIAFAYVKYIKGLTSVILGMDNLKQLNQNVALLDTPELPVELKNQINRIFGNIPIEVLNPSNW